MAFQPCPGIVSIEAVYTTPGGTAENVLHAKTTSGDAPTTAQLHALFLAAGGVVTTNWFPQQAPQVSLSEVRCTDLTTVSGGQEAGFGGGAGTHSGVIAPDNVTWAVKLLTAIRGRSFRGRIFWIGIPSAVCTGDTIDTTYAAAVVAAVNAMRTAVEGVSGFDGLCVLSRFSGVDGSGHPIPRANGIGTKITSATETDFTLDSMRRRLKGRGR